MFDEFTDFVGVVSYGDLKCPCKVTVQEIDLCFQARIEFKKTDGDSLNRYLHSPSSSRNPLNERQTKDRFSLRRTLAVSAWRGNPGTIVGFNLNHPQIGGNGLSWMIEHELNSITICHSENSLGDSPILQSKIFSDEFQIFNSGKSSYKIHSDYLFEKENSLSIDGLHTYKISTPYNTGLDQGKIFLSLSGLFKQYSALFHGRYQLGSWFLMVNQEDGNKVNSEVINRPLNSIQIAPLFDRLSWPESISSCDFQRLHEVWYKDFGLHNSLLVLIDLMRTGNSHSIINTKLVLFPMLIESLVSASLGLLPDCHIKLSQKITKYGANFTGTSIDIGLLKQLLGKTRNKSAHRLFYDSQLGQSGQLLDYWIDTAAMIIAESWLHNAQPKHYLTENPDDLLKLFN